MSNLAFELPAVSPRLPRESPAPTRHIEIVSTRSQRRARPRAVYALVTVAGLFVILMAQLLLSILLSQGAYEISALQASQTELTRDQQTLTEELDVLKSPQSLSARAVSLGMVISDAPAVYLRLSDGQVIGTPKPASGAEVVTTGTSLISNSLLPENSTMSAATAGTPGAPSTSTATGSVASEPGALLAPVTH